METHYLITVELSFDGNTYIRNVLQQETATETDIQYYYHNLLGLRNYDVRIQVREVPSTFTLALLGAASCTEIPKHFPSFDIEMDTVDARNRFYTFLERVCEMERMRAECGIPTGTVSCSKGSTPTLSGPPDVAGAASASTSKYQSWVSSILRSIRLDTAAEWRDVEEDASPIADSHTIAWILTPVLDEIRSMRGCRIITDSDLGIYWAPRLGTELFPDVAICRRLSTIKWRVHNSRSAALARTAIEWYIESQHLECIDTCGISPWIPNADKELTSVLLPFQNLGPRESFCHNETDAETGAPRITHPVIAILHKLEEDGHVLSGLTHPGIYQPSPSVFEKYLRHIFKVNRIGSDLVDSAWGTVEDTVRLWVRGNMGVDPQSAPLFAQWEPTWNVLLRDISFDKGAERFALFVDTLDAYDPITSHTMTNSSRYELVNKWIAVFVDREMEYDSRGREKATLLYSNIREWVLQFVPMGVADNPLKPMNIGPVLTSMGYICHKLKQGRLILNIRYKQPPANVLATRRDGVGSYGPPIPTNGPSVLSYIMADAEQDRNTFRVTVTNEIFLGKM